MTRRSLLPAIAALCGGVALAAPGDPYHKIRYCDSAGAEGQHFGSGDCETASAAVQNVGWTVKGCTDLIETGVAPISGNVLQLLIEPELDISGPLINLGQTPSGISILWYPAGGIAAFRMGADGTIQSAPLVAGGSLINPRSIVGLQVLIDDEVQPPFPYGTTNELLRGQCCLTFTICHFLRDPGDPTATPSLRVDTFAEADLVFEEAMLPCSIADLDFDNDIDIFDLIFFLQNFTPTPDCGPFFLCPADIDRDGDIDVFDLILFLQNFDPNDPNCTG